MQKICDLFVPHLIVHDELKFLSIFDKDFNYKPESVYEGFVNVNVKRIKLITFVVEFKKRGIECYNVPIEYRDNKNISEGDGIFYARNYANKKNYDINFMFKLSSPLYWGFEITNDPEEKVGGVIYVDKVDGHIWSLDEYEEYHYDYNNCLF
ncbi:hypothetical protein GJV03_14795 [Acinetobacter sp. RIT698]|jgi:hypothetical protein|uniref:hypothetical protein n=1 Tax=Acinetobacter sp. RIT698 TaxID=2666192 RepID=UPI0012AC776F|nr:hypothetical protein [Acinetobacter sp. RIT698]MRT38434.1 hypothetical protein [Acinetobacter sp. RIT698]